MKVVIDTNVVVSGFLSPHGACTQILYRISQGDLELLYDPRIFEEYRDVLHRQEFGFHEDTLRRFLQRVEMEGYMVIPRPLRRRLPDPDDEAFLEVALEGQAEALITGNHKHFPASAAEGIKILSPNDFLNRLRRSD